MPYRSAAIIPQLNRGNSGLQLGLRLYSHVIYI